MFSENDKSGFSKTRVNGPCLNLYDQEKNFSPIIVWLSRKWVLYKTGCSYSKDFSLNSFLASGDFCHLLITFCKLGNSLDPDQDRQNISSDLDPNGLTL